MKQNMKLLILGALAAFAYGAGPVQQRLGQVQARSEAQQIWDDLTIDDLDCPCDFTIGNVPTPGGSAQLVSYQSGALVSQGLFNEQIPNTAIISTCEEECCACAVEQEASVLTQHEHQQFNIRGSINVEESLLFHGLGNGHEESVGENEKVTVCSVRNQNGGSGTIPSCVDVCVNQTTTPGGGGSGNPPTTGGSGHWSHC